MKRMVVINGGRRGPGTAPPAGVTSAGGHRPITIIELHPFEEKTQTMKMR